MLNPSSRRGVHNDDPKGDPKPFYASVIDNDETRHRKTLMLTLPLLYLLRSTWGIKYTVPASVSSQHLIRDSHLWGTPLPTHTSCEPKRHNLPARHRSQWLVTRSLDSDLDLHPWRGDHKLPLSTSLLPGLLLPVVAPQRERLLVDFQG